MENDVNPDEMDGQTDRHTNSQRHYRIAGYKDRMANNVNPDEMDGQIDRHTDSQRHYHGGV